LAGVLRASDVAVLHREIDPALCAYALLHRDLAGPCTLPDGIKGIATHVFADGWRCLSAWAQAQPEGIGPRVRLTLPPDPALDETPDADLLTAGPAIVRRAAA